MVRVRKTTTCCSTFIVLPMVLKVEDAFRSHAEQQVEDAEVWLESVFVGEDLPIWV